MQNISILAIESSCDDTSAAVVVNGKVLSNVTASQQVHEAFGGVVPELASRAHQQNIVPVVDKALKDAGINKQQLNAIAFTRGPGLIGSLLVGTSFAKGFALALGLPIITVNHMQAHVLAHFIDEPVPNFPFLCLTVSGGHTQIVLVKDYLNMELVGESIDDAAGEAFDKTAKLMGFPYPGGVWIDRTSKGGDPKAFSFPVALPQKDTFDFSFSGLKTAVSLVIAELKKSNRLDREISNLCASVQEAIVENLWRKIALAISRFNCRSLAIVGGVAANSRLREKLSSDCPVPVFFPKHEYCTDNGAMIAAAGAFRLARGQSLSLDQLLSLNAIPYPEF